MKAVIETDSITVVSFWILKHLLRTDHSCEACDKPAGISNKQNSSQMKTVTVGILKKKYMNSSKNLSLCGLYKALAWSAGF